MDNDTNNPSQPPASSGGPEHAHISTVQHGMPQSAPPAMPAPPVTIPPTTYAPALRSAPAYTYPNAQAGPSTHPNALAGPSTSQWQPNRPHPYNVAAHVIQEEEQPHPHAYMHAQGHSHLNPQYQSDQHQHQYTQAAPHHPTLHIDTSLTSAQSSVQRPPAAATSSSERVPRPSTAPTSLSQANQQQQQEAKKEECGRLPTFFGVGDATVFREFADLDIGAPGLGVSRLMVEAIHEYFVKNGWWNSAKCLQQEALGSMRSLRNTEYTRRERERVRDEVLQRPGVPWPDTDRGALHVWFEEYCRLRLFPASRRRQAAHDPVPSDAGSSSVAGASNHAIGPSTSGVSAGPDGSQVRNPASNAQTGQVEEIAGQENRHGGTQPAVSAMASASAGRGDAIVIDPSPRPRSASAEYPRTRPTVDDLIEEERARQALFYPASQAPAPWSTPELGRSRSRSRPSAQPPPPEHASTDMRPSASRQRANTASAGLHMYRLPTVNEESPTEPTNTQGPPLASTTAQRPTMPQSLSVPTVPGTGPRARTPSGSELQPEIAVMRLDAGSSNPQAGPSYNSNIATGSQSVNQPFTRKAYGDMTSRITGRRNSKGKGRSSSMLKEGVVDKGKGKAVEAEPTSSPDKRKSAEVALERRRSGRKGKGKGKGKGKAPEMSPEQQPPPERPSTGSRKAKEVLTYPPKPDERWPGFDHNDFYKEHTAAEMGAFTATGLRRWVPPTVQTSCNAPAPAPKTAQQDQQGYQPPVAEEFELVANTAPTVQPQQEQNTSPVDTAMVSQSSEESKISPTTACARMNVWLQEEMNSNAEWLRDERSGREPTLPEFSPERTSSIDMPPPAAPQGSNIGRGMPAGRMRCRNRLGERNEGTVFLNPAPPDVPVPEMTASAGGFVTGSAINNSAPQGPPVNVPATGMPAPASTTVNHTHNSATSHASIGHVPAPSMPVTAATDGPASAPLLYVPDASMPQNAYPLPPPHSAPGVLEHQSMQQQQWAPPPGIPNMFAYNPPATTQGSMGLQPFPLAAIDAPIIDSILPSYGGIPQGEVIDLDWHTTMPYFQSPSLFQSPRIPDALPRRGLQIEPVATDEGMIMDTTLALTENDLQAFHERGPATTLEQPAIPYFPMDPGMPPMPGYYENHNHDPPMQAQMQQQPAGGLITPTSSILGQTQPVPYHTLPPLNPGENPYMPHVAERQQQYRQLQQSTEAQTFLNHFYQNPNANGQQPAQGPQGPYADMADLDEWMQPGPGEVPANEGGGGQG